MVHLKIGDEVLELTWEQWEQRVSSGRVPPDSLVRFEPVTGDAWVEARTLEMYESLRNEEAIAWRGQFLQAGPPVLTALLVGLNIRFWWLAWWSSGDFEVRLEALNLTDTKAIVLPSANPSVHALKINAHY